jgi:molybdopterin-guanine dinucleotide biosynthesis protein A
MERQAIEKAIPAAILAGGRSLRMRQDKASIEINGRSLAQRLHQILSSAGCSPVVLVGRQPALLGQGLPVLCGEAPLPHPLSGIVHALEHFEKSVLFAPVDLPCLGIDSIELLLHHNGPCVATGPDEVQPLLCVLGMEHLGAARDLLEQGGAAHSLVRDLPRITLPSSALLNCNHPADLDRISTALRVS